MYPPQKTEKSADIRGIILASLSPQHTIATASNSSRTMKRSLLLAATVVSSLAFGQFAGAQTTVATDPVGFTTIDCLANSDTYVSVPFTRPPEFVGAVQSISGNTITVSGSPWAANQFGYVAGSQPKTYFVLIGPHASSNPKEGNYYTVTGNGTNTLTINPEGDDLSAIQPQTQILVMPYPTLGSVFPVSDANVSFVPSASALSRRTQILIPSYGASGINLSTSSTYYYLNDANNPSNSSWKRVGGPAAGEDPNKTNWNDQPFVNSGYFIVRNGATATKLTHLGSVLMKKSSIPLITRSAGPQDNFVSVVRPTDVKLKDLGLISSGAFTPSTGLSRKDQLIVFNNSAAGLNKSAAATYFYLNNAWQKVGGTTPEEDPDAGNHVIKTGSGFIIRKAATAGGETVVWKNAPTYQ